MDGKIREFKWIFLAGFSRLKPLCAMTSSRKKTWICWNLTQFAPPSVKKAQLTIENDYPRETREEKWKWKKIEEWAKSKKFAFKGMHTAQFLFLCHNRNEIKKQTNSGQNIFLGLCTMLIRS